MYESKKGWEQVLELIRMEDKGVMSHLFSVYINGVMKEVKIRVGRMGARFSEEREKWKMPGLLYADN